MIEIKNLSYKYKNGNKVLNNINLNINKGEFVCIIGKNGSGKSTFSKLLSGLLPFKDGKIIVNGINLKDKKKTLEIRKTIGIVFQNPENQILFDKVYDDIAFSLQNLGFSKEQISNIIDDALNSVNMSEYKNSYTDTLSLGQKQRIASARAIITNPKLVLADEPTGALDSKSARQLLDSFENLNKNLNATILLVTHDAYTASYADRILFIKDGKIFNELIKGSQNRKEFFERIIEVVTLLGGELNDVI